MIVSHAQGGLGNQLFQYSIARGLAIKHNCDLILDYSWYINTKLVTPRTLELHKYAVEMRLATPIELKLLAPFRSRFSRYFNKLLPLHLHKEMGCSFNSAVVKASRNSYLYGYWQSELYFSNIRETLLAELTPLEPPSINDLYIIDLIKRSASVSLHIRRGDYSSVPEAKKYHGLCRLSYYQKAIEYICERVANVSLFVFSDDLIWAKSNLLTSIPTYFVEHNKESNAFQDLRLMSLCSHHILANSSFSWWGAWLSQSDHNIVIAPNPWYADSKPRPALIPSRWISLPN